MKVKGLMAKGRMLGVVFWWLSLLFLLSGCKVELYTNLQEEEVNEMMSLLLRHNIACEKVPGQEQTFTLLVDEKKIATSLELFREYGYPRPKFKNLGEVFKREGMVSSPMEERVRFIYALSQELAGTISNIDGVLSARVHIVLPENNPLSDKTLPSAASVFIKHRPELDVASLLPKIKSLVAHSIEGLSYDRVAVVLVESQSTTSKAASSPETRPQSSTGMFILLGVALLLLGFTMGGLGFYLVARKGFFYPKRGLSSDS
ncbi:MAG: type III secretion inner membrane ring lipoprotein SctJ [Thermodesulforhabdaceae bacterium]